MAPSHESGGTPDGEAWFATARRLSSLHASQPILSHAVLTRYLAELHELVESAPRRIAEAYKLIPESMLAGLGSLRMGAMMEGDFAWAPAGTDEATWAQAVGGQFRAYDDELLRLVPTDFGPKRHAASWQCGSTGAYVIPRRRPNRPVGGPGRNNSFARRALLQHRIFPCQINGDPVEVIVVDDLSESHAKPVLHSLGAAGFDAIALHVVLGEKDGQRRFRVVDQVSAGSRTRVKDQVVAAFDAGCFAVVWPELTMTPELRGHAARSIAEKAFDARTAIRPRLWVTGSWHEEVDGKTFNRSHVLDRNGRHRHAYDKMSVYHTASLGFEDITIGLKVPVIVTDEAIVGVAICKDFCMKDSEAPVRALPFDLVLVPSFGGETTITEHIESGQDFRIRNGGACFVVQQMCDEPKEPPETGHDMAIVPSWSAVALAPGHSGLERNHPENGWVVCDVQLP